MSRETATELYLREFERLKRLADQAMAQVGAEEFAAADDEVDNSLAIMVKHMAGNMRSRWRDFLTSDGEKPDRHRDQEFVLAPGDSRQHLMERWEAGWELLFQALRPLEEPDYECHVTIRGEPLTVLQAVNRQLTHYAYHVGQIVYVARHHAGESWRSLSVPKGESKTLNQAPSSYLDKGHP